MVSTGDKTITFAEVDEVNHPTATYIYSEPPVSSTHQNNDRVVKNQGRVDVIHPSSTTPSSWSSTSFLNLLVDVFLPAGYPHSVGDDYVRYQIFDSLQAFSSSIAGLLSSRAVLQGVGVGNANASPTSALLLHILQDSSGRVATILFAHRVGTALEPECKMYRLAADVFNDVAMILDCLSPMIPAGASRVIVLSTAGVLRALCGVAGGSSKASLSAHFSRWGNLAEVNAKDSSQETIISLIGMLVGSLVVSRITSYSATWISLIILLTVHLSMNYAAVRAVQMTSLNRQRANIAFSALLGSDPGLDINDISLSEGKGKPKTQSTEDAQAQWRILTPAEVAREERIFETDGVLRWISPPSSSTAHKIGFGRIGISVQQFLASSSSYMASGSLKTQLPVARLASIFETEPYLLFLHRGRRTWYADIVLKSNSTTESQLKAWAHALFAARVLSVSDSDSGTDREHILAVLSRTLELLNEESRFDRYIQALTHAGWDVSVGALETRSGRRIICDN